MPRRRLTRGASSTRRRFPCLKRRPRGQRGRYVSPRHTPHLPPSSVQYLEDSAPKGRATALARTRGVTQRVTHQHRPSRSPASPYCPVERERLYLSLLSTCSSPCSCPCSSSSPCSCPCSSSSPCSSPCSPPCSSSSPCSCPARHRRPVHHRARTRRPARSPARTRRPARHPAQHCAELSRYFSICHQFLFRAFSRKFRLICVADIFFS